MAQAPAMERGWLQWGIHGIRASIYVRQSCEWGLGEESSGCGGLGAISSQHQESEVLSSGGRSGGSQWGLQEATGCGRSTTWAGRGRRAMVNDREIGWRHGGRPDAGNGGCLGGRASMGVRNGRDRRSGSGWIELPRVRVGVLESSGPGVTCDSPRRVGVRRGVLAELDVLVDTPSRLLSLSLLDYMGSGL